MSSPFAAPTVEEPPKCALGELALGLRSARNHPLPDGCLLPVGILLKLGEDFQDIFPHGASVNAQGLGHLAGAGSLDHELEHLQFLWGPPGGQECCLILHFRVARRLKVPHLLPP
jgi:hypothetical protein